MLLSNNTSFIPAQWVVWVPWPKRFYRVTDARSLSAVRRCESFHWTVMSGTSSAASRYVLALSNNSLNKPDLKIRLFELIVWIISITILRLIIIAVVASKLETYPEENRQEFPYAELFFHQKNFLGFYMFGIVLWFGYSLGWRSVF